MDMWLAGQPTPSAARHPVYHSSDLIPESGEASMSCIRLQPLRILCGVTLLVFPVLPSAAQNRTSPLENAERQAPPEPIRIASGTLLKADLLNSVNWKRIPRDATIEAR